MAGRKRSSKNMPKHIDPKKLPKGIYWDNSGTGHWYISFFDANDKQRRKRVAGGKAVMSDLHRIIEAKAGVVRDTFNFMVSKYFESLRFKKLAASTQNSYKISFKNISTFKTKSGSLLGTEPLSKWNLATAQRLTDYFAEDRGPTAANHAAQFAKSVFNWAMKRGYANNNPYSGIEMAKERKKQTLPKKEAYINVLDYAKNSTYEYIWMIMELAYLCRMRGIEVLNLTDKNEKENGLLIIRCKGSRNNIMKWNKRLETVWYAAKQRRKEIQDKKKYPIPLDEKDRFIFVSKHGSPLQKSSFNSAWQRVITSIISQGIIKKEDRFSLHDLKRKGITDTKGNKADKMRASGHRSEAMMNTYDHEVAVVEPASDYD